jgi:hypothetical protein
MSLAHDLIDAALAADLTKNELKTFLVLFRQTLCFGKTSDALTLKRIVKLSGTRKDRVKPALKRLVEVGLFEATPHKVYEHTYTIAAHFQAVSEAELVAPSVPKNGKGFRNSEETFRNSGEKASEIRIHTIIPTTDKTTTTTTDSRSSDFNVVNELPYPSTWDTTQRSKAAQVLDGLSPQQAHDCLQLLAHSLNKGKVTNAMGYLHTLVKAARSNTLDRSPLASHTPNAPQSILSASSVNPITHTTQQRLNAIKNEIAGLDALFSRAGIPMDARTAAKRAGYVDEYNTLRGANHG